MRNLIATSLLLAGMSTAAAADYVENRDLDANIDDGDTLMIVAGAGTLDVVGVDGTDKVTVKATIVIPDSSEAKGKKIIAEDLTLDLEQSGDTVTLTSKFDSSFWSGSSGRVDLEVRAPRGVNVTIDDGSGSMDVAGFQADVKIDDGSGSIDVRDVGNLEVNDGSGSIDVDGVAGDVYIDDGSGGITVDGVGGTVRIDDGSGSIRVTDVAKDLILLDDGSGSFKYSDVRGTVSGDI